MKPTFLTTLAIALLHLIGCASQEAKDDPTSAEALRKAEPIAFGCAYVERKTDHYDTVSSETRTPKCVEGVRCDQLHTPDSYHAYAGGEVYSAYVFYEDLVDFLGTCETHTPLPGVPNPMDHCYAAPALCARDPNCAAIRNCVQTCAADTACAARCRENGEMHARDNFHTTENCGQGRDEE